MSNFLDTPLKLDIPNLSSSAKKAPKEPTKVTQANVEIIIVEKPGTLKTTLVKDIKEEELYKKCAFKKPDGFVKQTEWSIKLEGNKFLVEVYAKEDGKANCENKYDFPPPIDTTLFYGNCVLICTHTESGEICPITLEEWETYYEQLFGGFHDLGDTSDNSISEDSDSYEGQKTRSGYVLDGFVVDDEPVSKSKLIKVKKDCVVKKSSKQKSKQAAEDDFFFDNKKEETYLDCSSELKEEPYFE